MVVDGPESCGEDTENREKKITVVLDRRRGVRRVSGNEIKYPRYEDVLEKREKREKRFRMIAVVCVMEN